MSATTWNVLGLIPARGGSKGVPRKNIRLLCGKPLLQYTAESALAARHLARVILSSDDEEVAKVGERCGLQVPFLRPAHLAQDDTPMLPVIQHALNWFASRDERFAAVCLLQPTNPLRRSEDIDGCIEMLQLEAADAVVTILPVPDEYNPHWVYFPQEDGSLQISTGESEPIPCRQSLPTAYHREGSVYVTRSEVVTSGKSLYGNRVLGYLLDSNRSVNIDSLEDWQKAETMIAQALNFAS
jgi:CMP-N,N'-diacetyllegionaminic acid synthase